MKKVLIVGADSYIGTSFENFAQERFEINTVSTLCDEWRVVDFSDYYCILFVAGIAHKRQSKKNKDLFFAVNRDLAYEVAQKARAEGVRLFIYLSSMAVYGVKSGEITEQTELKPAKNDYYGLSKYEAERTIMPLETSEFSIAIIRPPMVYGPNCKGNFPLLVKIAKKAPLIPTLENKRSMIFVDNLSMFLAEVIERGASGIFLPQNEEYADTAKIIELIAKTTGKNPRRSSVINPLIRILMPLSPPLQKAFGSLYYSNEATGMLSIQGYQVKNMNDSIIESI